MTGSCEDAVSCREPRPGIRDTSYGRAPWRSRSSSSAWRRPHLPKETDAS